METNNPFDIINYTELSPELHKELLEMRNHEEVRKQMFTNDVIPFNAHMAFVASLKADTSKAYFAAYRDGELRGAFNIIRLNDRPEYGYFSSPSFFEGMNGIEIYYHGLSYLIKKFNLAGVFGQVLVSNRNPYRISEKFGFEFSAPDQNGVRQAHLDTAKWKFGFNDKDLLTFISNKKARF